jgi:hypothetical protein
LLRALTTAYPGKSKIPTGKRVEIPKIKEWKFDLTRIFGRLEQSETLIVLSQTKELDAVHLCATLPSAQANYQTMRRLLFRLAHQGVLTLRRRGVLMLFGLNAQFVAARQLRGFVKALAAGAPKYQYALTIASLEQLGSKRSQNLRKTRRANISYPPIIDMRNSPQ